MSQKRQTVKAKKPILRKVIKQFFSVIKKQTIWIIRRFSPSKRRRGSANAGFVLPTVAMVALVVVLLTTAILFRSFERAKNASNVRVNEAALNAATPAVDRARAKINKLFQDARLPRATPTDKALDDTVTNNINEYTFGDETQIKLSMSGLPADANSSLQTAWVYPVDTNNNGLFDSYTLYGIYFKNPPLSNGAYKYARNALEARTPPMTAGSVSGDCGDTLGTSATLVGSTGWFNIGNKLKKAFFVYTVTVPITTTPTNTNNYEKNTGNKGFSALEFEQDRVQLPLVNNAVIYEDDIGLSPGPAFRLNGRIFTNSNFLTASPGSSASLYQVSSLTSCFYTADNAKITVGGNLGAGGFTDGSDLGNATNVHLYQGKTTDPSSSPPNVTANKSVTNAPRDIAYNSLAYVQRLNRLVSAQTALDSTGSTDPLEVKNGIIQQQQNTPGYTSDDTALFRQQQLYNYFKRRTRRVPYAEVAFGGDAIGSITTFLQGSGDTLRPPDVWIYPFQYSTTPTTANSTANNGLTLNTNSNKIYPSATEPTKQLNTLAGNEQYLGDRVLVGNNLPELWWNGTAFVGPNTQDTQAISGTIWDDGTPPSPAANVRTRRTQVQQLADFGATDRDGDWELAAAKIPSSPQDPSGGLRVITGTGIYLPSGYTTTGTTSDSDFSLAIAATQEIWSDMMPVASDKATQATITSTPYPYINLPNPTYTPYLRMRASVVYHYNKSGYSQSAPQPIACVSSYYDPTNSTTARNQTGLPNASPIGSDPSTNVTADNTGNSNNGVVYPAPDTAGETTYASALRYQAQLKYRNGRLLNPILNSLYTQPITSTSTIQAASTRTLSERSAVESAICALQILDGTIGSPTNTAIPHGAIIETAFLDARQIKAIHADVTTGVETFTNADGKTDANGNVILSASVPSAANYDLAKEQRQPLEIRATVLDIDKLRKQTISGGIATATEYLLPNSGIIYATRDDALLDLSAAKLTTGTNAQKKQAQTTQSPVDFILDPTRRPNAIILNNGSKIWRGTSTSYRDVEKGLILASNLPVYVKGDFNLHTQQEFTTALADDWGNFYTRTAATRNVNFACRSGDPRLPNCTTGDEWRPASVLADAITLLSNNFQLGFRNDGDYDLNNNLGDRTSITKFQNNGFYANAYVTNASWYDASGILILSKSSSYLNNFVTPILRRKNAPEYLMEVCPKLPVSECDPAKDWYVNYDPSTPANNRRSWLWTDTVPKIALDATLNMSSSNTNAGTTVTNFYNTTLSNTFPDLKKYPRRVAFQRNDTDGTLVFNNSQPVILGITGGKVKSFPLSAFSSNAGTKPDSQNNALWFRTTTANDNNTPPRLNETLAAGTTKNPRLIPVLQVQNPTDNTDENNTTIINTGSTANWLQIATETTFNLAAAAGDTPARPTEDNGGLHNFVRFMENWNPVSGVANAVKARISGSFIQFKRSAYATGPFRASLTSSFYPITGNSSTVPFYIAPTRQWGYDVGLLSQSPDLFAQKLARTPTDVPDEYFREVSRDDPWVATLLCAKKPDSSGSFTVNAVDADQRPPAGCS